MRTFVHRALLAASFAAPAVLLSVPAGAQETAAPAIQALLQQIFAECRVQLELGNPECQCVIDRLPDELEPIEVEYVAVRITGNDAEVERLRQTLHLGQRLGILVTATGIIQDCAGDMPIRNPL